MPTSDAFDRIDRLHQIQLLFWRNPAKRLRTIEIASELSVSDDTIRRDLEKLSADGRLPVTKDGSQFWRLTEGAKFELLPMKMNLEEAVVLYLAGRLLSQIHDERNEHMLFALRKLIAAMPPTIATHQQAIVEMARERQEGQEDRSDIFRVLAHGWAVRRVARLVYAPPRKKTFECRFSPYLLEPSGIGRTVYAIGHSTPPNSLRTYKLERIEHAELTNETFELHPDFDGPTLLKRAWGVMYGDEEPVEVRLRFSHYVTKRVKETLWHPSQQLQDTPEGCEWAAQIGDTLEIENWIRGWGSDCEVLAPQKLRNKIVDDVRRSARMYGIAFKEAVPADVLDEDLFNKFFGE